VPGARLSERLQELVLENAGIDEFIAHLATASAEFAAAVAGLPVLCSVRLARLRQPVVMAGSAREALALEKLQDGLVGGPGLAALKTGETTLIRDTATEPRWDRYVRAAGQRGARSILSIPLALDRGAAATLTLFAASPDAFDGGTAEACEAFVARGGKSMRLAVRLGSFQSVNRDLLQAMKSRTIINLAAGILMGQSRCSQAEAIKLLSQVSNNRNVKLRTVAEEILQRFETGPCSADFSS
jgi:GAF domain-containing protein